jgi:hypothetical protein
VAQIVGGVGDRAVLVCGREAVGEREVATSSWPATSATTASLMPGGAPDLPDCGSL